ncbi:hypothetical protein CV751_21760 [Achromobacter ruhlandii]|nr:hypothetical protein CV751_21760 [Achromobacter ruhlandii]
MPINFIELGIRLAYLVLVVAKNISVPKILTPGILIQSQMVHAMPAIDPTTAKIIDHLVAKGGAHAIIKHRAHVMPSAVIGHQRGRNDLGNLVFQAIQRDLTLLQLGQVLTRGGKHHVKQLPQANKGIRKALVERALCVNAVHDM